MSVQNTPPAALISLVACGENPLSPPIFDANVTLANKKGASVQWHWLEPEVTTVGSAAFLARAPNTHAVLLSIDLLLSTQGQQLILKRGPWLPRRQSSGWIQRIHHQSLMLARGA